MNGDQPRKPRRTIRYHAVAENQLESAIEEHDRVYEMVKSLELLLERHPDNYLAQRMPRPNDDLWIIRLGGVPGHSPSITYIYTWDDAVVHVIQASVG